MKSIVIVTEAFDVGGLETHIRGEIIALTRAGCSVHLATGYRFNTLLLPREIASVTNNLPLGPDATLADFMHAVDELRRLICEHSIECVHAHPFTSLLPGLIAAELERVPFALTLHGPVSLANYYGPLYDFILTSVVLPKAGLVISVSREIAELSAPYLEQGEILVQPNGVDINAFSLPCRETDPRWLIVSRLDFFKVVGIADFIVKAKLAGLPGVLLVGDGPARGELQQRLIQDGLAEFTEFYGVSENMAELMSSAAGVAGMGRVVLEGLASQKPVCLVGYDGVKGLVDRELFAQASQANFSGRNLKNINSAIFCEQLDHFDLSNIAALHEIVSKEFSESSLWVGFLENFKTVGPQTPTLLSDSYRSLLNININETVPLLQSAVLLEQLGRLVHGARHFEPDLAASFLYHKDRFMEMKPKHAMAEHDGQIVELTQALAERNGQIVELTQALAERNGQIASLNQALDELNGKIADLKQAVAKRDEQVQACHHYKLDKEMYVAQLLMECEMRDGGLSGILWNGKRRLKQISHYYNRSRQMISSGGLSTLIQAIRFKLKNRNAHRATAYTLPTLASSPSLRESTTSLHAGNIFEGKCLSLLPDELVVFAGVPFDDIGGGQRGAQLARCALKTGRRVIYIYVYPKFDFNLDRHVESDLEVFGLTHLCIDRTTPAGMLDLISGRATILIEFPHPKILPYLHMAKGRGVKTVFELIDDWETSLGGDWFDMDIYRELVAKADVVVGTAKPLVRRLVDLGRNDALYLPNAANEYIFDKYKAFPRPTDLPKRGKRTALYFGSLYGEWFGWEYIAVAAAKNANLDIILIGDNPGKKNLPTNVYFLGSKKIDELPAYLMHSDLAILPFIPGKISDAVSPIKVFEYLFAGKPVVSTPLPEVIDYPGVSIATDPQHFAELCGAVTTTDELVKQHDMFISRNSWFYRLDLIISKQTLSMFKGAVSAVILIHNNKNIIGRCLETLILHGTHYLREIIVVDNASADGGAEFVENTFPSVRVLKNSSNGCSSGRNLGASVAQAKYLAFFDSDQWFTTSIFFDEALSILERDASVGAIGWGAGWFDRTRPDLGGMIADYCPNRAMNDVAIIQGYRSDIGYLGTCGFFMPKSVFDAADGFDTYYDPTCFEDTDLSFQIRKLGFKVCYRDLTGIRHQPHQTTGANSQSNSYTKLFVRNSEYFKRKWANHRDFFVDYPG